MTPDRWERIKSIYWEAMELDDSARGEFLDRACTDDPELRLEIDSLIEAHLKAGDFIVSTAVGDTARTLASEGPQSFIGRALGNYHFISLIGSGGMGDVYLAIDTRLGRRVAVKVLVQHPFEDRDRVRRFQREARTASALNHPNIITIYDFGREDGREYIVSEYIEGSTLREAIRRRDLTLNLILDLAIQVGSALEAAHTAGIVHRDIKPENIMLRPDGYAKVLDFGLAKLTEDEADSAVTMADVTSGSSDFRTRAGVLLGTVNYMSPEQARGQKLDGRSDLFSLGVILYEMLTGRRPFSGETWHHTIVSITDSDPQPIADLVEGVPGELQLVIDRALAKDRLNRYQNAREMLSDLQTILDELDDDVMIRGAAPSSPDVATAAGGHSTEVTTLKADPPAPVKARSRFKKFAVYAVPFVVLTAFSAWFFLSTIFKSPVLTNKDTILLTDFENTTGDEVFDDTLRHGLIVQLEQSPYFNILPEQRARETLALMERPRDVRITRDLGREICQRRGIKALIAGSIAPLGRNYVITLEAINSLTGEAIAHEQVEAAGREQVLRALGRASKSLREQLGESLASIQKFDAPIEQATTSSLDALRDYALGIELRRKGEYSQSITAFERAIERDGEFALACVQLGTSYRDMRNISLGNSYLERAYRLRNRVSERERLQIAATYFRHITGELDKRIETSALLTRTYPQDPNSHHLHGNSLMVSGEFRQAEEAYAEALRLDPDFALSRANLALARICQNRFDEAERVVNDGLARHLDSSGFHNRLYLIAFIKGDTAAAKAQVDWYAGRPDEYQIREIQARSLAFAGRLREANQALTQAAALADARKLPAERIRILADQAYLNALFGLTALAGKQAMAAIELIEREGVSQQQLMPSIIQQLDSPPLALTLALCGRTAQATALADRLSHDQPKDTIINAVWLPMIRATMEIQAGGAERSAMAVEMLQSARGLEASAFFRPQWIRAQALLQSGKPDLAAAEFQSIIDHRGQDAVSPLWPLAHLGLARSRALRGDEASARRAYLTFLDLWKDADPGLPILIDAKRELSKLKLG